MACLTPSGHVPSLRPARSHSKSSSSQRKSTSALQAQDSASPSSSFSNASLMHSSTSDNSSTSSSSSSRSSRDTETGSGLSSGSEIMSSSPEVSSHGDSFYNGNATTAAAAYNGTLAKSSGHAREAQGWPYDQLTALALPPDLATDPTTQEPVMFLCGCKVRWRAV